MRSSSGRTGFVTDQDAFAFGTYLVAGVSFDDLLRDFFEGILCLFCYAFERSTGGGCFLSLAKIWMTRSSCRDTE